MYGLRSTIVIANRLAFLFASSYTCVLPFQFLRLPQLIIKVRGQMRECDTLSQGNPICIFIICSDIQPMVCRVRGCSETY